MPKFQKGQSGNPAGRPKGVPTLAPAIKRVLEESIRGVTNRDAIAAKLVALARGGDMDAIKVVLDRVDGKLVTPVEHAGEGGGPVRVEVVYRDEAAGGE